MDGRRRRPREGPPPSFRGRNAKGQPSVVEPSDGLPFHTLSYVSADGKSSQPWFVHIFCAGSFSMTDLHPHVRVPPWFHPGGSSRSSGGCRTAGSSTPSAATPRTSSTSPSTGGPPASGFLWGLWRKFSQTLLPKYQRTCAVIRHNSRGPGGALSFEHVHLFGFTPRHKPFMFSSYSYNVYCLVFYLRDNCLFLHFLMLKAVRNYER